MKEGKSIDKVKITKGACPMRFLFFPCERRGRQQQFCLKNLMRTSVSSATTLEYYFVSLVLVPT